MKVPDILHSSNLHDVFAEAETPFYFYDMRLFRRTVGELASLASRYGIRVHYAVKANSQERLMKYIASFGFGAGAVFSRRILCLRGWGRLTGKSFHR